MTVAFQSISSDPCYNYESLDRPWRANNESGDYICDEHFSWNGWYRLFYNGMDIQMSETCVSSYSCNTYINLWLSDPHPQIEDGVVIRELCGGSYWGGCCAYKLNPIRVKACPGNYYVYELVNPQLWCAGYCTDVNTISQAVSTVSPDIFTGSSITLNYDPCSNYNILDNQWRTLNYQNIGESLTDHDDTRVEWDGWYRLFINGSSAQMPEWCLPSMSCGGYSALYLGGSHPRLEDGVVTCEINGSRGGQCSRYRSNPIQVKACPGNYYVYKFTRPTLSIPAPVYCAVAFQSISSDPCYNYESLDRPWRANNESGDSICDDSFSWNGWYRLFYNGMDIRMSETCVSSYSCNTEINLWLSDPHPQIEDGVVIRELCGSYQWSGCCAYKLKPIRVKVCPGNYYVYELVNPQLWCAGYCTDVSTISQVVSTVSPDIITGSGITLNDDPCNNYNILDNDWRRTLRSWYMDESLTDHDDTRVEWDGWYRLFINGSSAQMPEWCFYYMSCGGFSSLYLGDSHPRLEDGVVTREIYGSRYDQCSRYRSDPIQVKACPANYYVYKFTRPSVSIQFLYIVQ
ncbi:uncharacterized protein LOC127524260 [Ctenopharyngodon idella]|uniref:uncharacterized protein LOC127524260 n=1 Tax=Ctenopharyngodon idella TaxID=7959 RepID=UPI002230D3DA|nr:uncharacterized protein LOC127524260 [Ctenopharyngodon idella]